MATKSFNRRFHGRCGGKFSFFRNPFVFVILWLVVAAGIGAIVMLLWNWLMPVIFGLPALSLWQALGLLVLMRILFGRFLVLAVEEGCPEAECWNARKRNESGSREMDEDDSGATQGVY